MARTVQRSRVGVMAIGAWGVVLGDIGTSPLYAFSEIFMGAHTIPVVEDRVLGGWSLIFWTLTLVVSVEYVVIGAALFYGDGVITPALSGLSAVEGIAVVAPGLGAFVVQIALVILVVLFLIGCFGTGRVGGVFGPAMLLWFSIIALLGVSSVLQTPEVLQSINPIHAVGFFQMEPLTSFLALGSVVL